MSVEIKNLIGYLLFGPFYACARGYCQKGLLWGILLIFNTIISITFNSLLYSIMYLTAVIFASWYLNKIEKQLNTVANKTPWLYVIGWILVYFFVSAVITSSIN